MVIVYVLRSDVCCVSCWCQKFLTNAVTVLCDVVTLVLSDYTVCSVGRVVIDRFEVMVLFALLDAVGLVFVMVLIVIVVDVEYSVVTMEWSDTILLCCSMLIIHSLFSSLRLIVLSILIGCYYWLSIVSVMCSSADS
jgi:hypothetical protein